MNNSLRVGSVQSIGHFDRDIQEFHLHRPDGNVVLEGFAFQIFHGDIGSSIFLANVVNRADIGMIQCRRGLRLALETAECLRIAGDLVGEKFQGDEAVQARILGLVNDPHPAAAQFLQDAVVRDRLAGHILCDHVLAGHVGKSYVH